MRDPDEKKNKLKAIFTLLITAFMWSLAGVLIKYIDWNPLAIAGTRSIIAAIFIYPLFIHKKKIIFTKPVLLGSVACAANVICFVGATKLTTAANAVLLLYTSPLFVAFFSFWLLREKILFIDWISLFFIFGGMSLFFLDDLTGDNMLGNILAIISGMAFAFMAIFMRMQKAASPIDSVFLGSVLTGIVGIPFMFGSVPDLSGWAALLVLGVVQLAIPYILFSYAIRHVSALESMLIPMIEPLLNPVWVFVFMAEIPGVWALTGGTVVLLSVFARAYTAYRLYAGKSH